MEREKKRLDRQIDLIGRDAPRLRGLLKSLRNARYRPLRIPVAIALILGSTASILPVFGLWMLPVGLLLLAVDVPALRPMVSKSAILMRKRFRKFRS
jgi:hypothetical protein